MRGNLTSFFFFFLRLFLEEEKKASSRGSVKSVVRIFIPSFNYIFFFFFISIVSSLIALLCYDSYIDSSHSFLFSFAFVFFFFSLNFLRSFLNFSYARTCFFFFFKKKRFQRENGRGCVRGKNCTDLVVLFSTRQSILFSFFFFKAVNKTYLTSLSGLQWLPVLLFCYTIKIPEQDLIFLYLLDAWVY